ncbi:hypothetical protein C2E23DRAFT_889406 [Lenzites betulinus]|nr:hypothetical protein C2E23DRAFT_889406 [Lenzites betulinus]
MDEGTIIALIGLVFAIIVVIGPFTIVALLLLFFSSLRNPVERFDELERLFERTKTRYNDACASMPKDIAVAAHNQWNAIDSLKKALNTCIDDISSSKHSLGHLKLCNKDVRQLNAGLANLARALSDFRELLPKLPIPRLGNDKPLVSSSSVGSPAGPPRAGSPSNAAQYGESSLASDTGVPTTAGGGDEPALESPILPVANAADSTTGTIHSPVNTPISETDTDPEALSSNSDTAAFKREPKGLVRIVQILADYWNGPRAPPDHIGDSNV